MRRRRTRRTLRNPGTTCTWVGAGPCPSTTMLSSTSRTQTSQATQQTVTNKYALQHQRCMGSFALARNADKETCSLVNPPSACTSMRYRWEQVEWQEHNAMNGSSHTIRNMWLCYSRTTSTNSWKIGRAHV